jgi:hypothetical protein
MSGRDGCDVLLGFRYENDFILTFVSASVYSAKNLKPFPAPIGQDP